MTENKYYLVLENRPGDYNIIEINSIPGYENYPTGNINALDNFTSKFTGDELRNLIADNNIVRLEYLNGSFKIISEHKKTLLPLTKDKMDIIKEFRISGGVIDSNLKDKLYGYYRKILRNFCSDDDIFNLKLKAFKKALNDNNKEAIFTLLIDIPYYKGREIYFMLWDELKKREKNITRTLEKNEKLSDVA